VAIDLTNIVLTRANLQDAADSAALAASSALSNDKKTVAEAKAIALEFYKTQMVNNQINATDAAAGFSIDIQETALVGTAKSFKITTSGDYTVQLNALTRLLGQTSSKVSAKSLAESATGAKSAISMFLVLDRSGSMSFKTDDIASNILPCQNWTDDNWGKNPPAVTPCYIRKVAALKTAVAGLTNTLSKADPDLKYVRTGAISYNGKTQTESSLAWGTLGALAYVNAFPDPTSGGTDSHTAFATAVQKLLLVTSGKDNENDLHQKKNGLTPTKYIVFMTDGENTSYDTVASPSGANRADTETLASCKAAKDAGIRVYTVAFMAPTRGQTLLSACATTTANYYAANDRQGLIKAFDDIGKEAAAVVSRLTQ